MTSFVTEVRRILSSAALALGGEIAQRRPIPSCAFPQQPARPHPHGAKRGMHAAILTVHECVDLASRVAARPQAAGAPGLSIAVGVH